jgi:hypothetical protein
VIALVNNIKGGIEADLYPGDSRSSSLLAKFVTFLTSALILSIHALGLMSKLIRDIFEAGGVAVLVLSWQEGRC